MNTGTGVSQMSVLSPTEVRATRMRLGLRPIVARAVRLSSGPSRRHRVYFFGNPSSSEITSARREGGANQTTARER